MKIKKRNIGFAAALAAVYLAFAGLGLPEGILGAAWPEIRKEFALPLSYAGIPNMIIMCASALSGFLSVYPLRRFGTAKVTFISCLLTSAAFLGYSLSHSFAVFIIFAVPLGLGEGAVDSGINSFVSENYSSRYMSWLHCSWGVGATAGPLILTSALSGGGTWHDGYMYISAAQAVIAVVVFAGLTAAFSMSGGPRETGTFNVVPKSPASVLKMPGPLMSVAAFFIYAGIEYSIGLWANSLFVEQWHMSKQIAGAWTSLYYGMLMAGRFISGFFVNRLGNRKIIRIGFIMAAAGVSVIALKPLTGPVAGIAGIMLAGFGLAPIYPGMMHETPRRFTRSVSSALMGAQVGAGYLGGSCVSALLGVIFTEFSLSFFAPAIIILILCALAVSERLNRMSC